MATARILALGQDNGTVTVPASLLREMAVSEGEELVVTMEAGALRLVRLPAETARQTRLGDALLDRYDAVLRELAK